MYEPKCSNPNPEDWLTYADAMALLQVQRTQLLRIASSGLLTTHYVGNQPLLWRAEVLELRAARDRLRRKRA